MQSLRTHARHLALLACGFTALGATGDASANGTILFTGELTDATCQVEGVGKAGATDFSVDLPTLSATQMDTVGVAAGHTRFGLQLSNCSAVANGVQAFFEAGPLLDSSSHTLRANNGGPVHFALFDKTGTAIRIGDQAGQALGWVYQANERMDFDVAYLRVRPGAITAGTFESQVAYSLHYL